MTSKVVDASTSRTPQKKEVDTNNDICCPKFDPTSYDGEKAKVHWDQKLFLKETVYSFFYIPLFFGRVTTRALKKLDTIPNSITDPMLMLHDMCSPWKGYLYISTTTKDIPNAEIIELSGTFVTKVYEGPYSKCGEWIQDMITHVKKEHGKEPSKIYANYTTCPKCAQKYGKNYVVLFAQID